jgi:hypothetical protein
MENSADNIDKYKEILQLDPRSQVFALLAEDLCAAEQWQEAIAVCTKGLHFYPDHLGARVLLGRALKETGRNDEAERILSNVAEEIRKSSLAFKLLSEIAAASGKEENSAEYAGMYEALNSGPATIEPSLPQEPQTAVEASNLEEFASIEQSPDIEELCAVVEPTIIEEPPALVEDAAGQALSPEPPAIVDIPDVGIPLKPLSEWDQFKAEAIEKLDSESEFRERVKTDLENILKTFAQKFDYRPIETAASQTLFSDSQKELLKGKIMALLGN